MALPSSSSPPGASPSGSDAPLRRRPARVLTLMAAGFLLLDAALLGLAGWWSGRPGLLALGALCVAGAVGVFALRRRYLARLDEIARARQALQREAATLARALRPPR